MKAEIEANCRQPEKWNVYISWGRGRNTYLYFGVSRSRANQVIKAFNSALSSHVAKETEKLQAEIDYIKREKLALNLLIDEITDGDCLKQSKAKLSAEIKELKAEVEKWQKNDDSLRVAYKELERKFHVVSLQLKEVNDLLNNPEELGEYIAGM